MFKESKHKEKKHTSKDIVMCLMNEVGEKVTDKNKKSVSTFGGTNDKRVTILSYECKIPNFYIFVSLRKTVDGQIH